MFLFFDSLSLDVVRHLASKAVCIEKGRIGESRLFMYLFVIRMKVCQNAHLLFLCTKPRLSQAGALLLPKDFVSLSISSLL